MNKPKSILLTGSVAYDYLMTFPGDFREHILADRLESISLSFLVESMVKRRGGIAPNIAYTLALLGGRPQVFAAVGEDFEDYRQWLERKGVDTTFAKVVPGKFTASFFATTDRQNAQLASFYPGAMGDAASMSLHDLPTRPDLVVVSPNDPAAMRRMIRECKEMEVPYAYDPSQQIVRVDSSELREGLDGATALFVNDYEFSLIQNKTGLTQSEVLGQVEFAVVTRGPQGASIFLKEAIYEIAAAPTERIVDPTGAGDAFRGGFLTGYSRGWDWALCGQLGSLAATYCLESDGPQGHEYTRGEFVERFRELYDDGGLLDVLL
ncbi:MAG: carbohydrate kinase family protein [Chloroflexi bacterium]|nr:carbohydrate kinase family protein [Chloroflexota bacterium]